MHLIRALCFRKSEYETQALKDGFGSSLATSLHSRQIQVRDADASNPTKAYTCLRNSRQIGTDTDGKTLGRGKLRAPLSVSAPSNQRNHLGVRFTLLQKPREVKILGCSENSSSSIRTAREWAIREYVQIKKYTEHTYIKIFPKSHF